MHKILSIGEIIWDVYPDQKAIGGAPLNFAAHTVLCGAKSALISAVGNDLLGDEAIAFAAKMGIDCRYVQRNDRPTGQCIVTLDDNAVPHYDVLRDVAYDRILMEIQACAEIDRAGYDAFYFGTLIQRHGLSRQAVQRLLEQCRFSHVVCDVNLRPSCFDAESVGLCLQNATILKVSLEEERLLRDMAAYRPTEDTLEGIACAICRAYPQIRVVLITCGGDGSYAYDCGTGRSYRQRAVGEGVVSTVGAGDSFTAAWLTSYLDGEPIEKCLQRAAEVSGFVVAHTEAIPLYGDHAPS